MIAFFQTAIRTYSAIHIAKAIRSYHMRAVKASQVGLAERNAGDINHVIPPQLVQGCVRDLAQLLQRDHL